MINSVALVGRTTKDIELRSTKSGKPVASFTLAVDRGKRDDGADFITCVAWDKTAETISNYVHKGDLFGVTGNLQTRSYEDKNGRKVHVTEVVVRTFQFLQPKKRDTEDMREQMDAPAPELANSDLPF